MSNVFRQIKNNDVHQRPFKAYKQYRLAYDDLSVGSITQSGVYYAGRIDQDGEISYPTNRDGTNQYVAWHAIKQKFYDTRPSALPEHALNPLTKRALYVSASSLILPYQEVGERIKKNSFKYTGSNAGLSNFFVYLEDDGDGNLIDTAIDTTNFPSQSTNYLYMSFNNLYTKCRDFQFQTGNFESQTYSGPIEYELHGMKKHATVSGSVLIQPGIVFEHTRKGFGDMIDKPVGLSVSIPSTSSPDTPNSPKIVIPHNESFNRIEKCSDWAISFWYKEDSIFKGVLETTGSALIAFVAAASAVGSSAGHRITMTDTAGTTKIFEHKDGSTAGTVSESIVLFDGKQSSAGLANNAFRDAVNAAEFGITASTGAYSIEGNAAVLLQQTSPGALSNTTIEYGPEIDDILVTATGNPPSTFTGGLTSLDGVRRAVMSKWGMETEYYSDTSYSALGERQRNYHTHNTIEALSAEQILQRKVRTPLYVTAQHKSSGSVASTEYKFIACDGTLLAETSASQPFRAGNWNHILIRNRAAGVTILVNPGVTGSRSDGNVVPLPNNTANTKDLVIGNTNDLNNDGEIPGIAEIRFYDAPIDDLNLATLSNKNFVSGSCFQTNVVGNVFYRNGAIVASAPLGSKYDSGSGLFSEKFFWNCSYRGTHTIYENQAFVRVPKDVCNVSMNPSATFTPPTLGSIGHDCTSDAGHQTNTLSGPQRKDLFVSGTLKPYITTIGLYNDKTELIAVGKLAQPIQKRDDVDMNFVIRWDY